MTTKLPTSTSLAVLAFFATTLAVGCASSSPPPEAQGHSDSHLESGGGSAAVDRSPSADNGAPAGDDASFFGDDDDGNFFGDDDDSSPIDDFTVNNGTVPAQPADDNWDDQANSCGADDPFCATDPGNTSPACDDAWPSGVAHVCGVGACCSSIEGRDLACPQDFIACRIGEIRACCN